MAKLLRTDAARNRERLLAVAHDLFTAEGATDITLEAIAKEAGVGIGTLYRHFPTRESLVEAVYRNEIDQLLTAADELLTEADAASALRAWMDRFAGYAATKRGLADALRAAMASGSINPSDTKAALTGALRSLLAAGAADGTLRADVEPQDVLATLMGVFLAAGGANQAGRMLDLVMDGLRTGAAGSSGRQRPRRTPRRI